MIRTCCISGRTAGMTKRMKKRRRTLMPKGLLETDQKMRVSAY